MSLKLCPKIILEGTCLTLKTEIACYCRLDDANGGIMGEVSKTYLDHVTRLAPNTTKTPGCLLAQE